MNLLFGWFKPKNAPKDLPDGALKRYLQAQPVASATVAKELKLLAIDLETTGLNPEVDLILSTGYVPIDDLTLDLGGAGGMVVKPDAEVGQSAVFHQLTDDKVALGYPLRAVLDDALDALTGRILLAHHTGVERSFLGRAIEREYGVKVSFESLDTMKLARPIIAPGFDDEPRGEDLRLWRLRGRYGLPRYHGHEALTDAIACAELFLAQVAELGLHTHYKKLKKLAG